MYVILEVPEVITFPLLGFTMEVKEHYRNDDTLYM